MGRTGCLGVIIAVLLVLGLGSYAFQSYEWGSEHNVTFTIQSLDDQANGSSGHKYLIFAADGTVYENTDSWLHGKTDSSNIWAKFLAAGKGSKWNCPVYAYRNTVLSSYPDILDGCKQVLTAARVPIKLYPTPTGKAPLTTQLTQTTP